MLTLENGKCTIKKKSRAFQIFWCDFWVNSYSFLKISHLCLIFLTKIYISIIIEIPLKELRTITDTSYSCFELNKLCLKKIDFIRQRKKEKVLLFTTKILKCTYVVNNNRTKYSTQGLGITRPARNNLEEFTTIFLDGFWEKREFLLIEDCCQWTF